jgi:hypothetical protein
LSLVPTSDANTDGASKRGTHIQSIDPLRPTSAAVHELPIRA